MDGSHPMKILFVFLGGVILLFIIAPLAGLFIATTPAEFFETVRDREVSGSIGLTLWTSMLATLIFGIAAIPFSWILARKTFPFKKVVSAIIDIPIVIPHSAAGIAYPGLSWRGIPWWDGLATSLGLELCRQCSGYHPGHGLCEYPFPYQCCQGRLHGGS
jgi:ABC-type Fe3+ transport system permease subunit